MSRRPRTATLAPLAALVFALACAHKAATSPPVTAEAPGALPGKFVWHDLVTDDAAASSRFYAALLGWEFEDTERLGRRYRVARMDGRRVAGLVPIEANGEQRPSQWIGYVSVADVDRAVDAVGRAGGRALVGPLDVPAGRAAVVSDPQGAALGLVRLAQGDPPDEASPRANGFFWMDRRGPERRGAGAAEMAAVSRLLLVLVLIVATVSMACESSVGVGLGVSYPGRYYGPVDSGRWGGGRSGTERAPQRFAASSIVTYLPAGRFSSVCSVPEGQ